MSKYLGETGLGALRDWIKGKLNGKVDTAEGKGLSSEDYTAEDKQKLAGLENYTLPEASAETLGGVKVGDGLAIEAGVLSAIGGGGSGMPGKDGKDGTTFIPSVDAETGMLSWSNNDGKPNPESVNIRGPKGEDGKNGQDGERGERGEQGADGAPGQAAGFGTPTATVDEFVGTPSVEVTADGPNTEKIFHFTFHNLKGRDGSGGGSASIGTVKATVDDTSGNPQVSVSQSGNDFTLNFTGINGKNGENGLPGSTGPQGSPGKDGANGANGAPGSQWYSGTYLNGTNSATNYYSSSSLTGTYHLGDYYLNSTYGYVYRCTTAGTGSSAKWTYQGSIRGATGPKGTDGTAGSPGADGEKGDYYYPTVSDDGLLSWTKKSGSTASGDPTSVNIKGPAGKDGSQGPTGPQGQTGPQGPTGLANITFSTTDIGAGASLETGKLYCVYEA